MERKKILVEWLKCQSGEYCDSSQKVVYIDGEYAFEGDYYHDKIDEYISGYVDGLKHSGLYDVVTNDGKLSNTVSNPSKFICTGCK